MYIEQFGLAAIDNLCPPLTDFQCFKYSKLGDSVFNDVDHTCYNDNKKSRFNES